MRAAVAAVMLSIVCASAVGATRAAQSTLVNVVDRFTIVPGDRFGSIRERTPRTSVAALFPGSRVVDADVSLGEGRCAAGAKVFPGTADEIDIAYQDDAHTRVALVRTSQRGGRWRTRRGVRVGTSLADLERLAGRPLEFSGFGWDGGGRLLWMEASAALILRLMIDAGDMATATRDTRSATIRGDRSVRSDHPLIRRSRVRVDQIELSWASEVAGERDCD